jgi:hypothetical protein
MGIEPTHAHEQFVGQQEIAYFFHGFDGTDNSHEKDKHQLEERDIFSLLFFGIKMFQERKDFDLLQVIEKGVKQGCFIHGINYVHLMAMEEMTCDFRIIPFSGMPEQSITECFL